MLSLASTLALAAATPLTAPPPSVGIEAPGPNAPLKGTLTGAQAKGAPVVLIIPGSGPTDRDGNNTNGLKAATYRLIAEGLADRGIASVRIDKRGMYASAGAVPDGNAVTIDDYVHDTGVWIDTIRGRTSASCVWLLGHSEGGLVALATAAHRNDGICGLVLVSTAGRRFGDVLKGQLQANPANAPLLASAFKAIDALAAGQRVEAATLPPPLLPLFHPAVQGFLISAFALDPAKLIQSVGKPTLILQGQRDLQIGEADALKLKATHPDAVLKILPDMNHVLKVVASDDRNVNAATYSDPVLPLAPGVVDTVAQFIASKSR